MNRYVAGLVLASMAMPTSMWAQQQKERTEIITYQGAVCSLAISKDGTQLLSGGSDGAVKLWDLKTVCL